MNKIISILIMAVCVGICVFPPVKYDGSTNTIKRLIDQTNRFNDYGRSQLGASYSNASALFLVNSEYGNHVNDDYTLWEGRGYQPIYSLGTFREEVDVTALILSSNESADDNTLSFSAVINWTAAVDVGKLAVQLLVIIFIGGIIIILSHKKQKVQL